MQLHHRRSLYLGAALFVSALFLTEAYLFATRPEPLQALDEMMERQEALPRYVEVGYSPLGRSPVVDTVLNAPFTFPRYAEAVAHDIKASRSLYDLVSVMQKRSGMQTSTLRKNIEVKEAPLAFEKAFGETLGRTLYGHFQAFLQVEKEV